MIPGPIKFHFYKNSSNNISLCVAKCPDDKKFLREDNTCYEDCNQKTYKYYLENNYTCLLKCPKNMTINDDICTLACPNGKFLDINSNKCINSCKESPVRNYYYNLHENICLPKCDLNKYYTIGYECVPSCQEGTDTSKKYVDEINRNCDSKCPSNRNYVIEKFVLYNDINVQNICRENCTYEYPFYEEHKTQDNYIINFCLSFCENYYFLPNNILQIPTKCEDKCPVGYEYYVEYENGAKQCFSSCPEDMPFYYCVECFSPPLKASRGRELKLILF